MANSKYAKIILFPIVLALGILAVVILELVYQFSGRTAGNNFMPETCTRMAKYILTNMDVSADPCQDFYKFACGNFAKKETYNSIEPYKTLFEYSDIVVDKQFKRILEEPINRKEFQTAHMLKHFYQACMKTENIQKTLFEEMKSVITSLGGWPVVVGSKWPEKQFNWESLVLAAVKKGINGDIFFKLSVEEKSRKLKANTFAQISPPDEIMKGQINSSIELATKFGAVAQSAEDELIEAYKLQKELQQIVPAIDRYTEMTLNGLQSKYKYLSWRRYLNSFLPNTVSIKDNDIVHVDDGYFDKFNLVMKSKSNRIQANYAFSYIAHQLSEYYLDLVSTIKKKPAKWKYCFGVLQHYVPLGMKALYIRKYMDQETHKTAEDMMNSIIGEFNILLKAADWLTPDAREFALNKLKYMHSVVGYTKELIDDKLLDKYYEQVKIKGKNFFESFLGVQIAPRDFKFEKLMKNIDVNDWRELKEFGGTSAYYNHELNSIYMSNEFLQEVWFGKSCPRAVNYGTVGFITAHEISHSYGIVGSSFDYKGELSDVWNYSVGGAAKLRRDCIRVQYGKFVVPELGINLPSGKTIEEDFADNSGVRVANLAYKRWLEANKQDLELPGIKNFTAKQIFWLASANVWCSYQTMEDLEVWKKEDTHSLPKFRVLGAFANCAGFAEDFHCPVGSPMNPKNKCIIF